jgi:RNase P subunit RPR2
MKKKISKKEAEKQIEEFFYHISGKKPKEVKKIKRLAMSYNIKLGERRKLFCKKCFSPYKEPSVRIKNDFITITCDDCGHKNRWKFEGELDLSSIIHNEEGCEC